jgi:hypothetical protein
MTPQIVVLPAAETEISEAFGWYEEQGRGVRVGVHAGAGRNTCGDPAQPNGLCARPQAGAPLCLLSGNPAWVIDRLEDAMDEAE